MERVCFLARVRPDRLEEYRARHREVWPEMTGALAAAGPTRGSAGSTRSFTWTEPEPLSDVLPGDDWICLT
jgi:hypothetical protein